MNPLVTIAIPTYQRLAYLQEAVASAQAQTYAPIEILISDDGPGTEIGAWVQTVLPQDPRIRYLKTPRNLGLTGNWNFILDAARGDWLIYIGDDDRLLPECVSKLAELIQPDAAVVFSNHYLIDAAGQRLAAESEQNTRAYERHHLPAGRLAHVEDWVWRNAIPLCSALLRTADVRRIRFKEDLNTPELVFLLPLAQEHAGFVFRPDYLMEYRTHPQSATGSGLWGERLVDTSCLGPPVRKPSQPSKSSLPRCFPEPSPDASCWAMPPGPSAICKAPILPSIPR